MGLRFEVHPADVDETPRPGEPPRDYVLRLAREKAAAVARSSGPGTLVLAADTAVVIDGEILGKPLDEEDARRMLRLLAGRQHEVLTGVALQEVEGPGAAVVETSKVRMAPLDDREIDWYVATGEPLDKAGGYAIQGLGALFVEAVDGNYSNVVGLPVSTVYRLFADLGYDVVTLLDRP